MYEAIDRGKDPRTLLEAQLKGFENAAEMPTACPKCEGALIERMSGEPGYAQRTRFHSCGDCLTVAWVFPEYSGRRMPSPPIPQGRRRHE